MESVQTILQGRGQCYTVDSNVDAPTQQVAGIVEVGQNGPQKPVQNRTTELNVKRMEVVQVTPQERAQYRMMWFADEVDVPMPLGMEDTVGGARGHRGRCADHTAGTRGAGLCTFRCSRKSWKFCRVHHRNAWSRLDIPVLANHRCGCSNINNITSSHKGAIDGEDPVLFADYEAIRSIPRYTTIDDVRHTQYADNQDKWLSESLFPPPLLHPFTQREIHLSCLF